MTSTGTDARANNISATGVVAGYASPKDTLDRNAMVWLRGEPFNLGTLGGTNSNVTWPGQGNSGMVAGIAQTAQPQTRRDGWSCGGFFGLSPDAVKYTCVAFVWGEARMHRLLLRDGDNTNGFAAGINNHRPGGGLGRNGLGRLDVRLRDQPRFSGGDVGLAPRGG